MLGGHLVREFVGFLHWLADLGRWHVVRKQNKLWQAPVFFNPLALRKACLSGRHALSGGFGMFELPEVFRGSTVIVHA